MTARTTLRRLLLVGLVLSLVSAGFAPAVGATASVAPSVVADTDVAPSDALGASVATSIVADAGVDATGATDEACSFPVTSTDATGATVTVEAEPETVVTLGPSAAQTMWEIGAREKVVGVSQYSSYLEGADSRTNVSGAAQSFVDVETVVALDPDLVLAPNIVPDDTVTKLRESGLTVYKFETATSLESVEEKTRLFGSLTGACGGADERAADMNRSIGTVRDSVADADRPRVLYSMGGGYTAGEDTFVDAIIEAAGGTNLAAEAGIEGYGEISAEVVADRDPEWIVLSSDVPTVPEGDAYEETTAYREGNVFVVDANYLNQPAPRTVDVVERMAATFHPDRYDGATPYETMQLTTQATTTTTTPGMGVAAAVLAVALVAFSLRRD